MFKFKFVLNYYGKHFKRCSFEEEYYHRYSIAHTAFLQFTALFEVELLDICIESCCKPVVTLGW